mmetsp:Transcript_14015/g.33891  ORF Transcript_14015/g.33891 Transcript_14015/m.33891 type:complete len:616 (+) Transcript_14015:144-1991(+)
MTVEMTTAHFDQTLAIVLSLSICGILFCAVWIILILIDIEATKVSFLMVDGGSKGMDLQLDVTTDDANTVANNNGMEVEPEPQSNTNNEPEIKAKRTRRVPFQFKLMQVGSVALLILLTYLLLVASNASWWLSALGGLAVFGMFLRFQIGDEIRLQRWDRLTLMVSLLLYIAALLNFAAYAGKALDQGEIYVGPARIVGYDISVYNNTNENDPSTRTNLMVQWGSDWGCPFSGGRSCEAEIQGVMCAVKPDGNRRRTQRRNLVNNQASGASNGTGKNHHQNATAHGNATHAGSGNHGNNNKDSKLEKQNEDLEHENEELKEEVEALKEKNDEEIDEMYDGETVVEEEVMGDALVEDAELIDADEDKEMALADEDVAEDELGKEYIKEQLEDATDDTFKEDLEHNIDLLDEEEDETEADLHIALDEDEDAADEYEGLADQYFDNEQDAVDVEIDEYYDEKDAEADIDETEAEIEETEKQLDADGWTTSFEYDDDMFENEYWNYDWDSAWGEYGCGELFDADIVGQVPDPSIPAGSEDSWPSINIYGSCKRCDAYVLDYFAEEAFERLDDYILQGIMFMILGLTGVSISLIGFIKYKLAPPAENQIELLGSEAGVIA